MLWVIDYEKMLESEKEEFRNVTNRLLSQTYLVYQKEDDKKHFRFCEKHMEVVKGYLLLSGWQVNYHRDLSIISVTNNLDKNRKRLTLEETLFLFILRLLYEDKIKELSLATQLTVSVREIQEKYMALKIKNRLPGQNDLQRILRTFQKHSLIELARGSFDNPDGVLILYPSITVVVSINSVESLISQIQEKEKKGDITDEESIEIEND